VAKLPRFYAADDDPLSGLFPATRSFTFAHAAAYQGPYFRTTFPPKAKSRTPGWNRQCNLATGYRLQQHVTRGDIVELLGFDHIDLQPVYEGIWFDSNHHSFAIDRLAAALILDLKRRRKVEDVDRKFYATKASADLTTDSLGKDGRSEFVDAQFTLESFHLYLRQADDEQSQRVAASWELLPLPNDYDSYGTEYRGDAIIREGSSEIIVCSPAIHGGWKTAPVHEFLESLPSRLGNNRFILLSPLGFRRWLRLHDEAPWQISTSPSFDGTD
jgi:hypothetical protein